MAIEMISGRRWVVFGGARQVTGETISGDEWDVSGEISGSCGNDQMRARSISDEMWVDTDWVVER